MRMKSPIDSVRRANNEEGSKYHHRERSKIEEDKRLFQSIARQLTGRLQNDINNNLLPYKGLLHILIMFSSLIPSNAAVECLLLIRSDGVMVTSKYSSLLMEILKLI